MGNVMRTDANADASADGKHIINVTGADYKTGPGGLVFDDESPTLNLIVIGGRIAEGDSSPSSTFKGDATFIGDRLGIAYNGGSGLSYNAHLLFMGNSWSPEAVTLQNLGSGTLQQCFDNGGGFDPNTCNTVKLGALNLNCAGQVTLSSGTALVADGCFSANTKVVICTDTSSPNPVECVAGSGKLAVKGTGSDLVNYASGLSPSR
jgi:hypothetical protein